MTILNLNKIHPLNRNKVRWGAERMSQVPGVEKIFIFGSSITAHCHVGSDVDVYVQCVEPVRGDIVKTLIDHPFDEYDVWTNFDVDERLRGEIEKNRVLVYEREA